MWDNVVYYKYIFALHFFLHRKQESESSSDSDSDNDSELIGPPVPPPQGEEDDEDMVGPPLPPGYTGSMAQEEEDDDDEEDQEEDDDDDVSYFVRRLWFCRPALVYFNLHFYSYNGSASFSSLSTRWRQIKRLS